MRLNRIIILALFIHLLLICWAIINYGYMGQDYRAHVERILFLAVTSKFDWSGTNPPLLYIMSLYIQKWISSIFHVEISSFVLAIFNMISIPILWNILIRLKIKPSYATFFTLLLIFIPFRVIHSVVYSSDALTVTPFFILVLLIMKLTDMKNKYNIKIFLSIGLTLTIAVFSKYTFAFLVPVCCLLIIFILLNNNNPDYKKQIFIATILISLLPTSLGLYLLKKNIKYKSYDVHLMKNSLDEKPHPMSLREIFFFKQADIELFKAPQYFKDELWLEHKYSYPALLHISTFTDTMNIFQQLPKDNIPRLSFKREQKFFSKKRGEIASIANQLAFIFAIPISIFALVGTLRSILHSIRMIVKNGNGKNYQLLDHDILFWLALAFFAPIFCSLPFIATAYRHGYWLPRLVMPSILTFIIFGFVEMQRVLEKSKLLQKIFFCYVIILVTSFILALLPLPLPSQLPS
ncbi:MAG: hypothetical protein HQK49_11580 [Oligoflexia bacterium]|nr:hypothetical protein [Oligoflexia bacterium]